MLTGITKFSILINYLNTNTPCSTASNPSSTSRATVPLTPTARAIVLRKTKKWLPLVARHGRDQNCPSARPCAKSSNSFAPFSSLLPPKHSSNAHCVFSLTPLGAYLQIKMSVGLYRRKHHITTRPMTYASLFNINLAKIVWTHLSNPPLDLLSVLAQRTAPHQNAHGSLDRSLPPGRTQQKSAYS